MVLKNKRVLLVFIFCFLFFAPFLFVKASPLELNYPEFFGQKITSETTLPEYIKYIFNFVLFAVGLIFLGSLVWTGITYLTSAGRPAKMAEAKERLGSAFLGVVIIFASYIILTSINPELAILKLPDLKPIEQPSKYVSNPQECKPEELNTIAHEIPIGDLIKNIFEQKIDDTPAVDLLQATVKSFDKFLKKEIEIGLDKETGSDKVNRISDLNKYLKSLSEDCHCAETKAVCQKPKNFSFPVGCLGDPCPKKIRKKIKKALDIDTGKVSALLNYRKKFNDLKNAFEQEGRRFRQLMDALEGCKRRELLNRREFYNNLAFIEKQNGEIKIIHSHIQAQADPLTFYCVAGGSIFDYPYLPSQEISLPEPEESPRPGLPEATTPASCPVYIPMGEALIEPITEISYKINRDIEDIIFYIDEMTADISKMEELISHCNRQHCKVNCACVPNPCFECCAGPHCIFCIPFCKSPCLQTVGTCFGDPCGGARKEIGQIPERLKIYEEKIFALLEEIQGYIEDEKFILEGEVKGEKNPLYLETIQDGVRTCMQLGPEKSFLEEPVQESFWELINCEFAIGAKGPDGKIIKECNPQSFYCCSAKPLKHTERFPSVLFSPSLSLFPSPEKKPYKSSEQGENKVPYFSQNDIKWRGKYFDCGTTLGLAGSSAASLAMVLNYFGVKTDPIKIADFILEQDYRNCDKGFEDNFICETIKALSGDKIKCERANIGTVLSAIENNQVGIVKTRGIPPYPIEEHYIVLTAAKERWGKKFFYYNDPSYDSTLLREGERELEKPADWLVKKGVLESYLIYK